MWIDEIKEDKTYWFHCGGWDCKLLVLKHYGDTIECIIPIELDDNGNKKSCDMGMTKTLNKIECERYVKYEVDAEIQKGTLVECWDNNENKSLIQNAVMPCFYSFDINRRVYEKDGVKSLSPIYEYHFVKIVILGENEKEYICNHGRTINKRSMLYKINNTTRVKVYTEQEKDDDIYKAKNSFRISELVKKSDANTLREVEHIIYKNLL